MRQDTGKGRGNDLVGFGCDGDGWRDADEKQQRRHQEPAAHTEHAGQDTDHPAQPQKQKGIDGDFGDRKVNLHVELPDESGRATLGDPGCLKPYR